jgi:hypothetical protein
VRAGFWFVGVTAVSPVGTGGGTVSYTTLVAADGTLVPVASFVVTVYDDDPCASEDDVSMYVRTEIGDVVSLVPFRQTS